MRRFMFLVLGVICLHMALGQAARSQTNSYKQTNLVTDPNPQPAVVAPKQDQNLVNPWGIAFIPGGPFWISDNASPGGVTTLYDQNGASVNTGPFVIPPPAGSANPATPTGIVANLAQAGFAVQGTASLFIFDTEDGTISGWPGAGPAILAVDNSKKPSAAQGAVYKGLALITTSAGAFLLATNFRSGKVEVYDSTFKSVTLSGDFTDPNPPTAPAVPAGSYAPFGIKVVSININNTPTNLVAVTYALQDPADKGAGPNHDPIHMAGAGYVDLYNLNGTFNQRIAAGGKLNAPWGIVVPPPGFGSFTGDLLIANFGDGTINAFDWKNGNAFVDQMKDSTGAVITNPSMWDMVFPSGGTGDPKTMYITAGLSNEMHGLFAAITANAAPPPPAADFTITGPTTPVTITAGNTGSFMVTLGGINGFNSAVNLTCSGQPNGSTCTVMPNSVSPASGGTAMANVSIGTSSNPYHPAGAVGHGMGTGMFGVLLPIAGLGFLGLLVTGLLRRQRRLGLKWSTSFATGVGLFIATACLLAASGCGGYGGSNNPGGGTQRGTSTVMITGTSGNLSHSASVTVMVQ